MFRCAVGGHKTKPGEKPTMIVVERRERTYTDGKRNATGWEIAREAAVCPKHALEHEREERERQELDVPELVNHLLTAGLPTIVLE